MKLFRDLPPLFLTAWLTAAAQVPGTGVNFNHATPAAPGGARNVTFQNDTSRPTVNMSAYVTFPTVQVACPSGSDLSTAVNACLASLPTPTGGICDARACSSNFTWNTPTTFANPNEALLLPCGTLTATATVTVSPTVRNSTIHGCAYQGGSAGSGTAGGSVWNYQGNGTAFIVGDTGHSSDTPGFYLTDLTVATPSAGSNAHAIDFYRTQEIDIERVYFIGDNGTGQTGITLDGTGNYSGGGFQNFRLSNFGTALFMTGNGTGAANASTFTRMHINCSTSGGSPINGVIGINLDYGDGNTFVGGDIESCDTMLILGAGASNNTFTGVRNENSNSQVNAASGSQYNLWLTGGTMFTGRLTDSGTHNTFWDAFHRQFNNLNGDLWRSQDDSTITNHVYTGIGLGNVRGRQEEWQTDVPGIPSSYRNAWLWGPGDGTTGLQVWKLEDLLNNVDRIAFGQYTTAGGNNQTSINGAGSGAVILNGSNGAGTGGIVFGSGGLSPSTIASWDNYGNYTMYGYQRWWVGSAEQWRINGASASAWALNDLTTGTSTPRLRFFADSSTDIDAMGAGTITINNTSTGGTGGLEVYGGGPTYYNDLIFWTAQNGAGTGIYYLPGIKSSGYPYCVQVDNSGYLSNTNSPCGTGSGSGSVTSVGLGLPAQFNVTGSPVTGSGTLTAAWANVAGHSFLAGLDGSGSAAPSFRAIAADDVPTLNQSTTANAATASASDHSPTQCSSGQFSEGDTTAWAANCAQVQYSQLGGTVPTWNQSTTGNAATATNVAYSGLTGTVPTWNQSSTGNAATATNVAYSGLTGTVPTWNQSTTGTAQGVTNSTGTQYVGINSGGNTYIDSTGTTSNYVIINGGSSAVGGGLIVYNSGASATTEFTVTNAGNVTAKGFVEAPVLGSSGTLTISGCSYTSGVGGRSAGSFKSGITGTCTVTITSGITATNGYNCQATDMTTPADLILETGYTTTTATIAGTTVSGDQIVFSCIEF
jgi:hypothetical protein